MPELLLTKAEPLIQPTGRCRPNRTQVFVLSAAKTSGKYYDRRTATRDTWVSEIIKDYSADISVTFVLAYHRNPESIESQEIQKQITAESHIYDDILQFAFVDHYYNLTLKTLSILHWVSKNCLSAKYVVKADDDLIVNTGRLTDKIRKNAFKSGITGEKRVMSIVRDTTSPFYIPYDVYPSDDHFPIAPGPFYVITMDSVDGLYRTAIDNQTVLKLEDVYVTGVIARKANVPVHDDPDIIIGYDYNYGSGGGV
ncbi:unnamed protein product [Oppiella nova]|uniref:Hexosyltransferase n=1 Tax=Oppiella nova TaxID=334625 RepID=A0A7R9MK25_9ACAR|nr:unnamed protein product [Oppiella nova]CAG2177852.1 unnamed protein product [Oppiella nova]